MTTSSFDLNQRDIYYAFWAQTPCHSIDYTLPNLWGWQRYFGLEWAITQNLIWIRQTKPEPVLWAPLGNWEEIDWETAFHNCPFGEKTMIRVPKELQKIFEQQLNIKSVSDRGQWEYIYSQTDLANLSGKAYHKKKNHLNQFIKSYGSPNYQKINDHIVEDVLALQDEWCQ
ncbi:MAG: DUF2156 domain-containing protein, partial [Desulfovibrio sp.]|nr:DUF2156 domain-containing protein [Desulfovibrio sp.]